MAGPGGGPPRRSHTKSRKGCKTCKRRHIRCDETFPQCRNCTKHSCRCDYNDDPPPAESRPTSAVAPQPDLKWTPEIEAEIDHWKESRQFPFPELNLFSPPPPQRFSLAELRLIHHICSLSRDGLVQGSGSFNIWTDRIPLFLTIASSQNFVMHALLAFSATHLAYETKCQQTTQVAYFHRGIALKGLKEAIGSFSRSTSDAVLAASILLSWQALEWRSWSSLMQGTCAVIEAMEPWKHETSFIDFMSEPHFPTYAEVTSAVVLRSNDMIQADTQHLERCLSALEMVDQVLPGRPEELLALAELKQFVRRVMEQLPVKTAEEQFDLLEPLRAWLFWLPMSALALGSADLPSLIFSAHVYAVALAVESLFPAAGASYFATMAVRPAEAIQRSLINLQGLISGEQLHAAMRMMSYPMELVINFRARANMVVQATPSIQVTGFDLDLDTIGEMEVFNSGFNLSTADGAGSMGAMVTEQNLNLLQQPSMLGPPDSLNLDGFDLSFPGYTLSNFGSDFEFGFDDELRLSPSRVTSIASPSVRPQDLYTAGSPLEKHDGGFYPGAPQ